VTLRTRGRNLRPSSRATFPAPLKRPLNIARVNGAAARAHPPPPPHSSRPPPRDPDEYIRKIFETGGPTTNYSAASSWPLRARGAGWYAIQPPGGDTRRASQLQTFSRPRFLRPLGSSRYCPSFSASLSFSYTLMFSECRARVKGHRTSLSYFLSAVVPL
jgi:hypothetical protein